MIDILTIQIHLFIVLTPNKNSNNIIPKDKYLHN